MKKLSKTFTVLLLISMFSFLVAGCVAIKSTELTILSHEMVLEEITENYYDLWVKGEAKNTGTKTLSYATIDVKFKDDEGKVLNTSFDSITDLAPGEIWRFEVLYYGTQDISEVESYEISVGTLLTQ